MLGSSLLVSAEASLGDLRLRHLSPRLARSQIILPSVRSDATVNGQSLDLQPGDVTELLDVGHQTRPSDRGAPLVESLLDALPDEDANPDDWPEHLRPGGEQQSAARAAEFERYMASKPTDIGMDTEDGERASLPDTGIKTPAHATSDSNAVTPRVCVYCSLKIPRGRGRRICEGEKPPHGSAWCVPDKPPLADVDPRCNARHSKHARRCRVPISGHTGAELKCPRGDGTFIHSPIRGGTSFTEEQILLLDAIVLGALHGRSLDAAPSQPAWHGLRAKVNGLKAQVARRRAERGDS